MKNKLQNKRKKIGNNHRILVAVLSTLLIISSVLASANINENKPDVQQRKTYFFDSSEKSISVTIPVGTYEIRNTEQGNKIFIEKFGRLLIPGKPNLPSKIFSIAIPPGGELVEVTFEASDKVVLPGIYKIDPAPLPRVLGQEDPCIYKQDKKMYEDNYNSVYSSDGSYPSSIVEFIRTAGYRKYNLVDVRITPFTYRPLSDQLTYYPEVTVHVHYTIPEKASDVRIDNLARTEQIAEEIIVNYDQAINWYPEDALIMDGGLHDFVIITLDSLTSSVTPLVNWETCKGRRVEVVTTSWISANYDGYDLAEEIRNFLRDKYPSEEWGIEDVLLVGHYDDVPMRRTAQDRGYGQPRTDFYYAELSLPDNESWDADGDHQYGEDTDPIDFYAEVNVGRIPWSDPATVSHICNKSVAYEQNNDPLFKKNILLLGAFYWEDTDSAVLMEYKTNSDLHPWMADWTMTKMYEKNEDYWSVYDCDYPLLQSNVMSVWPTGTYAFVNWGGHGSPYSCHIYGLGRPAFIHSSDCSSLNDDYPAIIFGAACSNSDTDHLNIGQAMLQQGAVGFLGATQVAFGCPGWDDPNDGGSSSMDYFFTTRVTSGNYTIGEAHQWALREMYTNGLFGLYYEMFEWGALWGNPNLGMAEVPGHNPPFEPSNPDPANNSVDIDLDADLSWDGGDYDPDGIDDDVYYDVYFGTTNPPGFQETIGSYPGTQTRITYDPGTLDVYTTYYWQIAATDTDPETPDPVIGPIWEFRTEDNVLPEWQNQGQNTATIPPGGSILLYAQGRDDAGLDYAYLAINETGEWICYPGIWWDLNWSYNKKITINHTLVEADLTNFPVLIAHTSSDFASHAQPDGDDFVFLDATNTTQYNHEIEYYNNGTGELVAWVNVPFLSSTEDTILYVYYGNATCDTQENKEDTWNSDFIMVHHMDGANYTDLDDSTANHWDVTSEGGDPTYNQDGKVGKCVDFDGAGDYLQTSDFQLLIDSSYTGSVWVSRTDNPINDYVFRGCDSYKNPSLQTTFGDKYKCTVHSYSGMFSVESTTSCGGGWQYITTRVDNATNQFDIFVNGIRENDSTFSGYMPASTDFNIGASHLDGQCFHGLIDDLRFSKIVRSEEWIKTSYNNMASPDTFITVRPEVASSDGRRYGSPLNLVTSPDEWVWTNFTWQNADIPNGTTVGWRIYYVDISGNENATDIMNFTVSEETPIPGDLDHDGDVDLSDLAQLLAHYGMTSGATYEMGDIDGDGDIDLSDLAALLANYGSGT